MQTTVAPPEYWQLCASYYAGTLSPADLDRWRAHRIPIVLRHVLEKSEFYQRQLAGIDVDAFDPTRLAALPFTTKADLRREMHAVLSGGVDEALIYYETTGTTGPPTPCPRGAKDIAWSNAHVEESWRHVFDRYFGDRRPAVGLMGPTELYAFGDTFGDVAQRLGSCHAKIWPESSRVGFRKALRLLKELHIEVVVGAPALCLNLAKAALHYGYDPRTDFDLKLFMVLGEICTPELAANVKSIWGADVLPTLYGSQEALAIGTGCARGALHLAEPNYVVEVLDPDTAEVRGPDGIGELCLTMLIDGSKPLIRYRTGDLVHIGPQDCGCGMPGRRVDVIGRVNDRIALGTGRFQPAEVESTILDGVRGCLGYQVVIDRGADGSDQVTVRLDLLDEISRDDAALRKGVAERLRSRCGVGARIAVTAELDPITNTGAFVSWKAARIQDNRTGPDRDVQVAKQVAGRHAYTT